MLANHTVQNHILNASEGELQTEGEGCKAGKSRRIADVIQNLAPIPSGKE